MSLRSIHLRKLLMIMFMDESKRRAAIRSDIRDEVAKESGETGNGGDFYGPFWFDAKSHVFGIADLHQCVSDRIEANANRSNLYPLLRDGFLLWFNERRRWTNEPFHPGTALKTQFFFDDLQAAVKIDSILSVRDGHNEEHFVYPYFSPVPALSEHAARLGLWLLCSALPDVPATELRILDVIRGRTFSIDRNPLIGDEETEFHDRYRSLLRQWDELRREY